MRTTALILFSILCISILYVTLTNTRKMDAHRMEHFETQQKHLEEAKNKTKIRYHPAEDQIKDMYGFSQKYSEIIDDQGNRRQIPYHQTQGSLLYYQPGSKPYEHYEIDYTDAIMLARM